MYFVFIADLLESSEQPHIDGASERAFGKALASSDKWCGEVGKSFVFAELS